MNGRNAAEEAGRPSAASWRRWLRGGTLTWFVARRLLWLVPVLLAVVLITFLLLQLAPGSPWRAGHEQLVGGLGLSETAVGHLDVRYGLDRPWWEQLVLYLRGVATFDFGVSYQFPGRHVSDLVLESLPETFVLAGLAFALAVPSGLGLGLVAALRHNRPTDYAVTGLATLGASVPNFVVGIWLIIGLSVGLYRATGGGFHLPAAGFGFDEHLVLPVVTLTLMPLAYTARLFRSTVLETLGADHVRTAEAKGLRRRTLLARHVIRNSLVPVLSALGPIATFLFGGTIVVETLFQIPGLGGTLVGAISNRDYPVVLAATIVYTLVVVVANLLVDLGYGLVDPRVRART